MPGRSAIAVLAVACAFAACADVPTGRADLLDFLDDGVTQRDEVRLRLGEPSATYEGETILAFRLRKDRQGYLLVRPSDAWQGVRYNLMLAFDAGGVLRRHALVEFVDR